MQKIETAFTRLMGIDYPIIAGPMFLVSNEALVTAVSEAGGIGGMPSLNWRTPEGFQAAVQKIKSQTNKPYAVNIIVNKSNPRVDQDLDICVAEKVPMLVTSLGSPKKVIEKVHSYGGKVFCDVVDLKYALKVQDMGCAGVIAVSQGAGGHAGPTSPLVLIPHLKSKLKVPVIAAGGIATGRQVLAALVLGADGVQIGTRFIATTEAGVTKEYKDAILKAEPEDIVMTRRISGTPAAVIRTPYIDKVGLDLNPIESFLLKNSWTKPLMRPIRYVLGQNALEKAAHKTTWKSVWSAGQGVGLIHDVVPAKTAMERLVKEYWDAYSEFKK
jgi:nitronate monooxygenase